MKRLFLSTVALLATLIVVPAGAQNRETPYWASIRATELNMRIGPSADYRIDWIYKRKGLPVKVVRVREGWRLIQDPEGTQGWVVARLLSPDRSAIVIGEGLMPIREAADPASRLKWNAEPGVVGMLGKCEAGWCQFNVNGRAGWVPSERLWGTGEP